MDIGKNIKRIRIKKGLTQLQAAKLCGMLEPQYRRYENGKSNPRASTVERIAVALSVPISELYKQPKYPVQYADNLAPFCPVCGSQTEMRITIAVSAALCWTGRTWKMWARWMYRGWYYVKSNMCMCWYRDNICTYCRMALA